MTDPARAFTVAQLQRDFIFLSYFVVRRHYCVLNRTQFEHETAKCSALDHMAMLGSTLDRQASRLDGLTDSELMAKFDAWIKNPASSPDCVFYK